MIEFMYTGNYTSLSKHDLRARDPNIQTLEVFKVADKYGLEGLADSAAAVFTKSIREGGWDSPEYGDVIRELYEECPDNILCRHMREAVILFSVKNEDRLLSSELHHPFREALRDVTLFGVEFRKASLENATLLHQKKVKDATEAFDAKTENLLKDRTAQLEALTKGQSKLMEEAAAEHRAKLMEMTVGLKEKRCPKAGCRTSFVVLNGIRSWVGCPYCGTEIWGCYGVHPEQADDGDVELELVAKEEERQTNRLRFRKRISSSCKALSRFYARNLTVQTAMKTYERAAPDAEWQKWCEFFGLNPFPFQHHIGSETLDVNL